jgi:hypothetical protein
MLGAEEIADQSRKQGGDGTVGEAERRGGEGERRKVSCRCEADERQCLSHEGADHRGAPADAVGNSTHDQPSTDRAAPDTAHQPGAGGRVIAAVAGEWHQVDQRDEHGEPRRRECGGDLPQRPRTERLAQAPGVSGQDDGGRRRGAVAVGA